MFNTLWPVHGNRKRLRQKVERYWTNFAATGDPNVDDLTVSGILNAVDKTRRREEFWPTYDTFRRARIELGDRVGTLFGVMREPFCKLWNDEFGYGFDRS